MQLPPSIDLNKPAITRIVAGMFVLLGLTAGAGAVPARISRELHRTILRMLKPAESAVRRLILIIARTLKLKAPPRRLRPAGLVRQGKRNNGQRKPSGAFPLFDPRQRFSRKPPLPKGERRARPSITFFRHGEWRRVFLGPEPPPPPLRDGLAGAASLVRRLQALKAALDDLPKQALRLVRAEARREKVPHLRFQSPLRPGLAPGARRKPVEEIDHVLERCQWLAREALKLDTS